MVKVKGKALIAVVAAIILLGGVGAGAYVFGTRRAVGEKAKAEEAKAGAAKKTAEGGVSVSIGKITTNLADKAGNRYIQVEVELVIQGQAEGGKGHGKGGNGFEAHVGKARDAVLRTLRSKTSDELGGEGGMVRLRKEIRDRVNESLGEEKVADVFFKDFVIQ